MKQKKCKECKTLFTPERPLQSVCGFECSLSHSRKKAQTKVKVEIRQAKEKLKSRSEWLKEAQAAFNAWIRYRDEGLPCISCNGLTGKRNAGHYRSVGAAPELRFEEKNCHIQCEKCNSYLSGNLIAYRKNLLVKIGIDSLEWLEGKHEAKHYSIEQIKEIKQLYKQKLKETK